MEKKKTYEQLRDEVISKYRTLYKDSLAMDACEIDKSTAIKLLQDPVYQSKTRAIKANLFADQLDHLDSIIGGVYNTDGKDNSAVILKALEMKNKLLFDDLNVNKDESTALNVTFTAMSKEDFDALETVEVFEGGNSTELGADFGVSEDNDSFEARMKAQTKQKLKEKEEEEKKK